jgi:hypothetical protein
MRKLKSVFESSNLKIEIEVINFGCLHSNQYLHVLQFIYSLNFDHLL